jgi:mannosyltransferase
MAPPLVICGGLALLTAGSLLLRTGTMDAGYWIDEAISVGIASHDLMEIPRTLRQDGSPPLYYLLLHGWTQVLGTGEAATRSLSLLFALLAVPVAFWAGCAVFDRRAGALAAAGAAGCPFLTYYAQETRMYSLVVVLSLLACASFVLAFVGDRRRHLVMLALWLTLLLYTHTWAVFLVAGMGIAWLAVWRARKVEGRDGARLGAVVLVLYAPWIPSLVFQASHTGAPWSARPSLLYLLGVPGALFGYVASPLLVIAVVTALRRSPPRDEVVRLLALITAASAGVGWICSQVQPAWSPRYLAVLFGPLLLALAATVRRGTRWTAAALVGVAVIWLVCGPPPVRSNARKVATGAAPAIRPGDLVVSTQPEQVPVLHRYLPAGVVYVTPLGVVPDPRLVDWRDGMARLRAGRAERQLIPLLDHLALGRRILVVTPMGRRSPFEGPWNRIVRRRTREWRAALHGVARLRRIAALRRSMHPRGRSNVRAELFEVRRDPRSPLRSAARL